jgi:hypothetical protein
MRRRHAAQINSTAISKTEAGTVTEQIHWTDAVPFDIVDALRGPPIPTVITLVKSDDPIMANKYDMASVTACPPFVSTQRLLSALQENKSFCDVDMDGHLSYMSLTKM